MGQPASIGVAKIRSSCVRADETPSIPPGPRGYWVLGNLPDFAGDLLGFLTRCARDYGDIVRLRLGTSPAVLLNRPNQIEQVLVTRQAEFVKYRFFWRHVTRVFGNGLLTSAGSLWQWQHALMAPAFRQSAWLCPWIRWSAAQTGFSTVGKMAKSGRPFVRGPGRLRGLPECAP